MKGAFKKDPQRARARENEPKDDRKLGSCPKHLDPAQRKAWREIVRTAIPGVLTAADSITVEMAARLVAKMRAGTITVTEMQSLKGLMGAMGMTPADRSKIIMPKPKDANPFDDD